MPPQQRDGGGAMHRVQSTSEMSTASVASDISANPRSAREYRVKKSKLIGCVLQCVGLACARMAMLSHSPHSVMFRSRNL